ncbi:hypothetical protein WJ96_05420 [Burkholderia ubonensis]|uniref:Fibrinogen C-terminal domain-containing protein n=1 Tax=Burkholderia ubonensis TaxID=101571 RepID=A0AAW3MST3_9BURK|nr:Ig domain-containing protein [Burkholderia ubonensis]KVP75197.1 hypothetical protein WJ93_07210 [Burkholderia ubonensis]KVP98011.1 hypothetical protein WJ96_05420 [Burkholderia ubonensis]KVZ92708.1 hypothetical protein WL25_17080 [Burkholderia ubonensis]
MKKSILAALLAASSISALASTYYVVVPVPNRTATAGNILVSLNPYSLPAGIVGRAYAGFDFNSALQVLGDPSYTPAPVRWSVVGGTLPAGLSLGADGKLTGTPTAASSSSFQVMAAYKTKAGQQSYQVLVVDIAISLAAATLPDGVQGAAYSYDLKPRLTVTGDSRFTMSQVTWTLNGTLPPGLQLNADGTITGVPTAGGTSSFNITASYLGKAGARAYQVIVGDITINLASATPPSGAAGQAYAGFDLKPSVTVSGDAAYQGSGTGVTWSVDSGMLPPGLSLKTDGTIAGTPTASGSGPVSIKAAYKTASAVQSYTIPLSDVVKQFSGYRAWTNGALATSCNEYRSPSGKFLYQGDTGDGVYRVNLSGTPTDVFCDMTTDGGGWTLLMKQAAGDGVTLQGDTTYWTNGTVLNDTAANLNRNNANLVSSAFAQMTATQYRLEASNESTRQFYSRGASTPRVAFSDAQRVSYTDDAGVPQVYPNWFIRGTTYPNGQAITSSRFGFNFMEFPPGSAIGACGARWGWSSNENPYPAGQTAGTHDSCGGLGAYGGQYGSTFMSSNKSAWQPATLYLWAK